MNLQPAVLMAVLSSGMSKFYIVHRSSPLIEDEMQDFQFSSVTFSLSGSFFLLDVHAVREYVNIRDVAHNLSSLGK